MNPFDLASLERLFTALAFLNGFPGVLAVAALSALMLIFTDWRLLVLSLGGQSILLSVLAGRAVPPEWALLRVITNGLIALMWALSARAAGWGRRPTPWLRWRWPFPAASRLTRSAMVLFVFLLFLAYRPRLPLPELDPELSFLCTWLVAMGLLALALSEEPLTGGIGLLWWLEAAALYYPAIERDPLVIGLLETTKLALGLACAYLIAAEEIPAGLPEEGAR